MNYNPELVSKIHELWLPIPYARLTQEYDRQDWKTINETISGSRTSDNDSRLLEIMSRRKHHFCRAIGGEYSSNSDYSSFSRRNPAALVAFLHEKFRAIDERRRRDTEMYEDIVSALKGEGEGRK